MTGDRPRVALIHGVAPAIAPAAAAVSDAVPGADVWNILDDRLITDAQASGGVTPDFRARMDRLIDHAFLEGADAVMITCSLYSFVASERTSRLQPVVGSDDAAFREAVRRHPGRILLVSSVPEALEDALGRLAATNAETGGTSPVVPVLIPQALEASRAADPTQLVERIVAGLTTARQGDLILFAQYALSPAAPEVARRLGIDVLTGPTLAARVVADSLRQVS